MLNRESSAEFSQTERLGDLWTVSGQTYIVPVKAVLIKWDLKDENNNKCENSCIWKTFCSVCSALLNTRRMPWGSTKSIYVFLTMFLLWSTQLSATRSLCVTSSSSRRKISSLFRPPVSVFFQTNRYPQFMIFSKFLASILNVNTQLQFQQLS